MARRWQPEYEGAKVGRVVLIHDVAASSATWGRVGPALAAQGWDTLALDLPAHGTAADRIDRPLDISSLAAAVIGQLPGRADLLVGHGLGGIVALVLVGHYPDIARAVVLEDPPAHSPAGRDALIQRILLDSAFSRADPANLAARMKGAHPHWTDGEIEQAIADLAAADVPSI
ncbi:MAG TPA: alpha/beta fold hydrolase, partial [Agromyces sp.]